MNPIESLHVAVPNALQLDWNLIRELYTKGLPLKQIAKQFNVQPGTIASRASRANWKEVATKANAIAQSVTISTTADEPESASLTKSSARVRSGLAGVLERSIERLEHLSFKTPKAALKANQELESVVRNAKTVFGWSEGQSQPSVRINVLSSFSVAPTPEPEQGKVIDVTSTPVQLPPSA